MKERTELETLRKIKTEKHPDVIQAAMAIARAVSG